MILDQSCCQSGRGGVWSKIIGKDGVESVVMSPYAHRIDRSGCVESPFMAPCPRRTSKQEGRETAFLGFIKDSIVHVSTDGLIRICSLYEESRKYGTRDALDR
jgi:hypothetical protein